MYRSAARRLLRQGGYFQTSASSLRPDGTTICAPFSAVADFAGEIPDQNLNNFGDFASSSRSTENAKHGRTPENEWRKAGATVRPIAHWSEEQARVLQASLRHVEFIFMTRSSDATEQLAGQIRLGWTDAALIGGARDVGVSPSIVGSIPRKEAVLVEFFMDDCLQRLIDSIDMKRNLKDIIPSERVTLLVKMRLEMQAPYISKWPHAISIQVQPLNISRSIKQRSMLIDVIWGASGDETKNLDWYVERTALGGIYSAAELYMLTDSSPDFQNTWRFLDERIKDAFDFKKTVQEAKHFVEAVGAGMGGSLQGFVKRVLQQGGLLHG